MNDEYYIALAIRLAEKGLYTADPNPRVGCILVKDDQVIGQGFHLTDGEGHAEANALVDAGDMARGSTAYVTLEPCSFHGRTPSCAKALIEAGVKRVVVAMEDPHEKNAGAGFQILRDAGIELRTPLLEQSAAHLNPGHISRYQVGMPFVRLKMAMSLDGKTALANGKSQWITGAEARKDVQKLRARSSAIVTGVQTVIDDNPRMNVRAEEIEIESSALAANRRRPVYVLDSRLRVPISAHLAMNPDNFLVCGPGLAAASCFHCKVMEADINEDNQIDLARFLTQLAANNCNEVLFECGPTLAGSLIASGLWNELVIYAAPKMMGSSARSLLKTPEIDNMGDLFDMNITDLRMIGRDIRITVSKLNANKSK
ncbi:MAG: bifunctional diaminohydroxyphosphoribosylaminopyrimidine deaminase/5-amino-6-(5-phosphoribosylamino)uracil reductase RibD [Pseudomonadales bacterium]|jgi:diaminohydroxyphosphoribosylaminopyrimidine deaminase/5-amino-6-(5-phosphoribosylamino)uracil reductase